MWHVSQEMNSIHLCVRNAYWSSQASQQRIFLILTAKMIRNGYWAQQVSQEGNSDKDSIRAESRMGDIYICIYIYMYIHGWFGRL